ncbi:hypothetical protein RND81_01G010200 [Saponaria officinalis]|uniref:Xyloglucan endotransglucosylase/hydrolase n=1 Tax=Saponaria officinalis TaxID=3572 RepID=A0AAW1NBP4_SAPOF
MLHICLKFILLSILINLTYGCPGSLTFVPIDQAFGEKFGEQVVTNNGYGANLLLKSNTGSSGFKSQLYYDSGLFSAYIKLPPQNYTAGVVVTFYTSNNEKYPNNHDEIDFEFLGHNDTEQWLLQTNFYGNGSMARGREERYSLWFDPSKEAHKYSIFWDADQILYYIDDLIIRKVQKVDGMARDFPSKPMKLYATNWDGSGWATDGGKYKANWTFEPFVAEYTNFTVAGCRFHPDKKLTFCGGDGSYTVCGPTTPVDLMKYKEFRNQHLIYSYCDDKGRYNPLLPECLVQSGSTGNEKVRNQESWSKEYVDKLRFYHNQFNQIVRRQSIGN